MKIAFWNGANYTDSPTDYVAAIAVLLAQVYKCNVVMSSNHISNHMLHDCFSGGMLEAGTVREGERLYYSSPEYHRRLWEMRRRSHGSILEIPMEGITIIYPPDVAEGIFYYAAPRTTLYLMDIAGENYAAPKHALEDAELIVVFLPPNEKEIQLFFQRFSLLIPKSIIVVEGYTKKRDFSLQILEEKYGVSKKKIKIIPFNSEFKEACEKGKLDYFIKDHLVCSTQNPNHFFMSNLRITAWAVHKACIEIIKKEKLNEQGT